MSLQVIAIPAYNDNYIWCIRNQNDCVVVDPGDAGPVIEYCQDEQLSLCGILITHHHWDHTDGIDSLLKANPDIPIYGPNTSKIKQITHILNEGDLVQLTELDLQLSVLEVPGHTLDHIAYYGDVGLFCGDTLFSAGCGRLFEGTPEQMLHSLSKFCVLPAQTKVYCTHEYTLANIKFAQAVEPNNQALSEYKIRAETVIANNHITLPSNIANELAINPFLRCGQKEVAEQVSHNSGLELKTEQAVFAALRKWKDNF